MDEEESLDSILEEYASLLPGRVEAIQAVWQRFRGTQEAEILHTLHFLCHKLAGSSGSYGYVELHKLTRSVADLTRGRDALNAEEAASIESLVSALPGAMKLQQHVSSLDVESLDASTRMLVYLVEDDEDQQRETSRVLSGMGFSVRVFPDMRDFRIACDSKLPDVVLMDLMHGHDPDAGIEAFRRLSNRFESFPPVIFISVRNDFHARMSAVQLGADHYFAKPLDYERLAGVMKTLVLHEDSAAFRVLLLSGSSSSYEFEAQTEMNVTVVEDVLEMPRVLTELDPDLVVISHDLKIFDAMDIARLIRQDDQWRAIPLLALNETPTSQVPLINAGFDGQLVANEGQLPIKDLIAWCRRARSRKLSTRSISDLISLNAAKLDAVALHAVVMMLDEDFLFTELNAAAIKLFPDSTGIGESFASLFQTCSPGETTQNIVRDLTAGKVWQGALKISGQNHQLQVTIVPFLGRYSQPETYVLVATGSEPNDT